MRPRAAECCRSSPHLRRPPAPPPTIHEPCWSGSRWRVRRGSCFPPSSTSSIAPPARRFRSGAERIEAAHAQWTADWLAWEGAHDAEFKSKAAAVAGRALRRRRLAGVAGALRGRRTRKTRALSAALSGICSRGQGAPTPRRLTRVRVVARRVCQTRRQPQCVSLPGHHPTGHDSTKARNDFFPFIFRVFVAGSRAGCAETETVPDIRAPSRSPGGVI